LFSSSLRLGGQEI